jgi:hypothetical protein
MRYSFRYFLPIGQELLSDYRYIVAGQNTGMAEIPLPFAGLFGKYVAKVLLLILYFTGPGEGVPFGGALLGFHLGHIKPLLKLGPRLGGAF